METSEQVVDAEPLHELITARSQLCNELAEHKKKAEERSLEIDSERVQAENRGLLVRFSVRLCDCFLVSQIKAINTKIEQMRQSLDLQKIELAETVIYASGDYGPHGDDQKAVNQAIEDLADGCTKTGYGRLRSEYIGCKNYDRWHHQGSDHRYGCGPRHGTIVFQIGLHKDIRDRLAGGGELTDAEKDAAIYYLLNLKTIMESKK